MAGIVPVFLCVCSLQCSTNHFVSIKKRHLFLQSLRFCLFDVDSDSNDLADHDNLGTAECTLAQILATQENKVKFFEGQKSLKGNIL